MLRFFMAAYVLAIMVSRALDLHAGWLVLDFCNPYQSKILELTAMASIIPISESVIYCLYCFFGGQRLLKLWTMAFCFHMIFFTVFLYGSYTEYAYYRPWSKTQAEYKANWKHIQYCLSRAENDFCTFLDRQGSIYHFRMHSKEKTFQEPCCKRPHDCGMHSRPALARERCVLCKAEILYDK